MAQFSPDPSTEAQKKNHLTYTIPSCSLDNRTVTLLEAPSLLASSGTTGFRTWEAALFLGTYLTSPAGRNLIREKRVVELGAGTGFLSILCVKHLGARFVLATDGNQEVISDIKTNLSPNGLIEGDQIQADVLKWGHTLINGIADSREAKFTFDLIIGADVTYDVKSIPSLMATLRELFELYPRIAALISATVRNEQTLDSFIKAAQANNFDIVQLDVAMPTKSQQLGFFIPTVTPIKIFVITHTGTTIDPFAF